MGISRADSSVFTIRPRSWWLEEALRADPGAVCPPLAGTTATDVCVVGGGFAGLWTAYELTEREPSLSVVLLERDVCGSGGSGANGGFFSSSWKDIVALCQFFDEEGGIRYATALADQVAELGRWCARHDADIDLHHEGIVYARAGEWQEGPGDRLFALLSAHGLSERLRPVDADEARRVADSPRFVGGVFTPDLATVQPAKLARELRRVLLERGVRIFEATPVQGLEDGAPAGVKTPGGIVRAEQIVLTTGAWPVPLTRLRRAFFVAYDFMVVTEPIPRLLEKIGWTSHVGLADTRRATYYFRKTDDQRIAIGGGTIGIGFGGRVGGRAAHSARMAKVAADGLLWLFPQLAGIRFVQAWSGPMDMSASFLPFFQTQPEGNVHVGLGFSGHGLTATKLGGKTLASLALHTDDEWSRMPVVGPPMSLFPPEPLRWPLVRTTSWLVDRGTKAEERGGSRGVLSRLAFSALTTYRNSRRPRRAAPHRAVSD